MNMHPNEHLAENIGVVQDRRSALRQMTSQQLLQLGTNQVVYLKTAVEGGGRLFMLYGADGEPLALADSVDAAAEMAAEHGLAFVAVH
jgi:hypothetical protein